MTLDARDAALQSLSPTVMVPRFGDFEPLVGNGHRFLVTRDGLWIETRRPWLHLLWPICLAPEAVSLPYGSVPKTVRFSFGKISKSFLNTFREESRKALPAEHAAWIVLHRGNLEYRELKILSASEEKVRFERPTLGPEESLVLDLHSHGSYPPFFSDTDNRDDAGEFKLSGVLGNCRGEHPAWEFRLCAGGLFIPLPPPV